MRRKLLIYCEACGGDGPGGDDFVIFHCLAFCSADCRDEYLTTSEPRRGHEAGQGRKRDHAA